MQDTWISSLIAACSVLLGVLAGAVTTYLATSKIEREKWARIKSDELRHDRRRALTAMMQWIAPLERAVEKAGTLASSYRQSLPGSSAADLVDSWPKPLDELIALDLDPAPRSLVPDELYMAALPIVSLLDHLQTLAIEAQEERVNMETETQSTPRKGREAFLGDAQNELSDLHRQILATKDDIAHRLAQFRIAAKAAYLATYE